MGKRAARMAGNSPAIHPITVAQTMPWISNCGVTMNSKASMLNVDQFMVAAWKPLKIM